ncbi:MAG: DoxX family membrane protein [Candidatus Methylomirabilales bacterium]
MRVRVSSRLAVRLGLAVVFLWFGVDKFLAPEAWVGWIPSWLFGLLGGWQNPFLYLLGGAEVLVGLSFLTGWYLTPAAMASSIFLAAVILSMGFSDIVVRDIGLLGSALSLLLPPGGHRSGTGSR